MAKKVRRCYWHDCPARATQVVVFEPPHILAGSRRDFCPMHADRAAQARGARRARAKVAAR